VIRVKLNFSEKCDKDGIEKKGSRFTYPIKLIFAQQKFFLDFIGFEAGLTASSLSILSG
jgi:hypothetical protein